MANIKIFEINEDGELIVNDPELADALQELTPQELEIRGGFINIWKCGRNKKCTINNICGSGGSASGGSGSGGSGSGGGVFDNLSLY